jgi:hypothetical protein
MAKLLTDAFTRGIPSKPAQIPIHFFLLIFFPEYYKRFQRLITIPVFSLAGCIYNYAAVPPFSPELRKNVTQHTKDTVLHFLMACPYRPIVCVLYR